MNKESLALLVDKAKFIDNKTQEERDIVEISREIAQFIFRLGEFKKEYTEDDYYFDKIITPCIIKSMRGMIETISSESAEYLIKNIEAYTMCIAFASFGFMLKQYLDTSDLSIQIDDVTDEDMERFRIETEKIILNLTKTNLPDEAIDQLAEKGLIDKNQIDEYKKIINEMKKDSEGEDEE